MIKGKQNWTVSNIKKMYESKQVLSFSHPIQRSSELWDIMQILERYQYYNNTENGYSLKEPILITRSSSSYR